MDSKSKSGKIILVLGGTGNQGRAVADKLVSGGWRVRALVRNPQKAEARALAWKGIELVNGDLDDRKSLDQAVEGAYGVFSVIPWKEGDSEREVREGKNIADAAKESGVRHYIYSSVGGAELNTGIPHFDSKWKIEEYIRSIGLDATVFRPVFMMYNFNRPEMQASIMKGTLTMPLQPDRPLQMLAEHDLAEFVRLAFERPDDYRGKAIELAGDELVMPEAAAVFSKITGRAVFYVEQPLARVKNFSTETAVMMEWLNRHGYRADIKALRRIHPGLMSLEQWLLLTAGWARKAA